MNNKKLRVSDRARMFINTLAKDKEFVSSYIAKSIGCQVCEISCLLTTLRNDGYLTFVRNEVHVGGKPGAKRMVYLRKTEIPVFNVAVKTGVQVAMTYIQKIEYDFTRPMISQRLNLTKSTATNAINTMLRDNIIEKTGAFSQGNAAYYRLTGEVERVDYFHTFIYGGNPEVINKNLHY